MKIRSKLAWTFIILLIVGILAISSYAIVFIKNYMERQGEAELEKDTRWLAVTVSNLPASARFKAHFDEAAETSGYQLALYDSTGALLYAYPDSVQASPFLANDKQEVIEARNAVPWMPGNENKDKLVSYIYLPQSINEARFIQVSQFKDRIFAPIKTIRWIIYYGIFISMGLVVIVSIWIARYLTKPITQIKDAAQKIADGDVNRQIDLKRNDEFGTLADSLNQMAMKLRDDTRQIRQYAEKQRQFFADITHEIRNPLHTISASLEMLGLDKLSDDKRKKYRTNVQNQVERINRLFKDLVTLQRYDSDEYFIEKRPFDLGEIARHMDEWHGERARAKGLEMNVEVKACQTLGDPGKIEQVIDNLVSNAIKYTNEGCIILRYEKQDGHVRVEVEDSGIGISREHLDRLFDRFYRTDKARSRDKGGTGLGLAVVRSILKAHGTDIEVESKVGEGSIFWFKLPAI